jgi:ubiquinone/menaquinone biosynthesis C-methylase UbiE
MPRPPFDHFRFVAAIYDRFAGDGADGEAERRVLAELLALPVDGWLLDAGGGTGRISGGISSQTSGVVVADASLPMLRQARPKVGLFPARAQAERLPFADGVFARILIVDAFHHFYDQEAVTAELWRVLRPGGRLVLLEPNIERWAVKLIALGERLLLMRSRFYRAEALERLFTAQAKARVTVDTVRAPYQIQLVAEKAAP